jgi:hypothetical protein
MIGHILIILIILISMGIFLDPRIGCGNEPGRNWKNVWNFGSDNAVDHNDFIVKDKVVG